MPKVGDKKFPYTPQGIKDAQAEAAKTGETVKYYNISHPEKMPYTPKKRQVRGVGKAVRGIGTKGEV